MTLAIAVEAAIKELEGQAVGAELELEGGRVVIEVEVFREGETFEVEIDGETGAVLEIEEEDEEVKAISPLKDRRV